MGRDTSQGPFVRWGHWGYRRAPRTAAYLGYLPPQIMELALQCALLAESSAQGSFLGIEKSLQVLEPSLRSQQVPLLLGIARKEKSGFQSSCVWDGTALQFLKPSEEGILTLGLSASTSFWGWVLTTPKISQKPLLASHPSHDSGPKNVPGANGEARSDDMNAWLSLPPILK